MTSLRRKRFVTAGREKSRIGEDVTEQLEYEPGTMYVMRHIYPKYACSCWQEDGGDVGRAGGQSD